jgi:hypothetical protein
MRFSEHHAGIGRILAINKPPKSVNNIPMQILRLDSNIRFCICSSNPEHRAEFNPDPEESEAVRPVLQENSEADCTSVSLADVFRFISATKRIIQKGKSVDICVRGDNRSAADSTFLAGSLMLLDRASNVKDLTNLFSPVSNLLETSDDITTIDYWTALYHIKKLGWLDLKALDEGWEPSIKAPPVLDILEYLHYDDPLNGDFHFVVPGKLLLFNPPHFAGENIMWRDAGGARHFSAEYYADLFADLGVGLVLRVGDPAAAAASASASASAFAARGIAVEDLPLDDPAGGNAGGGGGGGLLRGIDRFLALLRRAPGAVAVHGGPAGLGPAAMLVAAYLVSRHGFEAAPALAWLRMAHPDAGRPAGGCGRWAARAGDAGPEECGDSN